MTARSPIRGMRQKMQPNTIAGNLTNSARQGHEHTIQELAVSLRPHLANLISGKPSGPTSSASFLPLSGGTMTGAIQAADGSAASPSVAWNTGHGIFNDTTDDGLGFSISGVQAAFLGLSGTTVQWSVISDGGFANNQTQSFNATAASASTFTMRRARGSFATPLVAALNDDIGHINFQPYRAGTGSGYTSAAQIVGKFIETGSVDSTHVGMSMRFLTCPIGSGTLAEQWHVEAAYQAALGPMKIGVIGAPTTSAALDISSTTGALLLPRMTTTQRNALTPTNGMVVYDSTLNQFYKYEASAWAVLSPTVPSGANPTATGSDVAVNGSSANFMRADGAPAIQKGSNSQFGLVKGDGTSFTVSGGVGSVIGFAPSGTPFHPGYQSGRWYVSPNTGVGTQGYNANTMAAVPFYVAFATTFTKIAINITGAVAAKNADLLVYANNNGIPGALEYDAGTISVASAGIIQLTGLSLTLSAGWHWLVYWSNGSTVTISSIAPSAFTGQFIGAPNLTTNGGSITGTATYSAGSPPNPFGTVTYGTTPMPLIGLSL